MIEIRRFVKADWDQYGENGYPKRMKGETVLQFRYCSDYDLMQPIGPGNKVKCTDWIDVPTVYEDDHDIEDT